MDNLPKFSIQDLAPKKSEVVLQSGVVLKLREMDLSDWGWVRETLGDNYLQELQKLEIGKLSRVVYRILTNREAFLGEEVLVINDEGFQEKKVITGPEKLLKAMTGGMTDLNAVTAGLLKSFGLPEKRVTDALSEEEKKTLSMTSVGANSTT